MSKHAGPRFGRIGLVLLLPVLLMLFHLFPSPNSRLNRTDSFVEAGILPTYAIESCEGGTGLDGNSSCVPSLIMSVTMQDNTPAILSFQIPTGVNIKDGEGRVWTVNDPIVLTIERSDITIDYQLTRRGFVNNAYDMIGPPQSMCLPKTDQLCCPISDSQYALRELLFNSTKYYYYHVLPKSSDVSLQQTIGNSLYSMS